MVGLITLYVPVVLPSATRKGAVAVIIASLLLAFLGALGLLRRGWLAAASLVYLCGGWLVGTGVSAFSAGVHDPAIAFYLLPASAAWLLGVVRILQVLEQARARSRAAEKARHGYKAGLEELLRLRTEQLEEARGQAQAARRAKSAFLANMSHELRSPLNAILLLCDPAWTEADVPEEVRQNNLVIYRSATQLGKAIDAVLDTAQAEAGQMAGTGASFCLDTPGSLAGEIETRPAEAGTPRVVSLAPGQPAYRVLIVDDHGEERSFLQRIVEGAGFEVQTAAPGDAGIEMFRSWRPHFIWIDPAPAKAGLETIRSIRGLDGGGDVTIAGVSGFGFAGELEEMLAAGSDDFIRKPFRPIEVFDCMALHLGVRYNYEALAKSVNG
jgi:CheY-like chemotaxis protein